MDRKIAIPVNGSEMLESHFGQTKAFAIYNIENDQITSKAILTPPPHAPGVLPRWINSNEVTDLLVSTMGERAKKILDYFNVDVQLGTPLMAADEIIDKFLKGQLDFDPKLCDHHHNHDHENGHEHHHYH